MIEDRRHRDPGQGQQPQAAQPEPRLVEFPDSTTAFRDIWTKVILCLLVASVVVNIAIHVCCDKVIAGLAVIDRNREALSPLFLAKRSLLLPGYRIKISASVPSNNELTYEVTLVDKDKREAFSFEQSVWAESGTWYEEGESGSWAEYELKREFSFVPHKTGHYQLKFAVSQLAGLGAHTATTAPLQLSYTVEKDSVPASLIWGATLVLLVGLILTPLAVMRSGKTVLDEVFAPPGASVSEVASADPLMDLDAAQQQAAAGESQIFSVSRPGTLHSLNLQIDLHNLNAATTKYDVTIVGGDGRGVRIRDICQRSKAVTSEEGYTLRTYGWSTHYFVPATGGTHTLTVKLRPKSHVLAKAKIKADVRTLGAVFAYFVEEQTG